jgi:dUTP pyrophosphatase
MTEYYNRFVNFFRNQRRDYSVLKIAVNPLNQELVDMYKNVSKIHNENMFCDSHPNSGFDLFVPETTIVDGNFKTTMISMDVKCEMVDSNDRPCGYYMYPRSSISKTPLMLANHVGIIDSGYRGFLIGAFRSTSTEPYVVEKHTRLLQVTNVNLSPIYVKMVDENELSVSTRGEGGFGSTGQ